MIAMIASLFGGSKIAAWAAVIVTVSLVISGSIFYIWNEGKKYGISQ